MTYYGSSKKEYEQSNGVRSTELHYCGDIDASGRLKLKRCVGKSFLDKGRKTGVCPTIETEPVLDADGKPVCPNLSA